MQTIQHPYAPPKRFHGRGATMRQRRPVDTHGAVRPIIGLAAQDHAARVREAFRQRDERRERRETLAKAAVAPPLVIRGVKAIMPRVVTDTRTGKTRFVMPHQGRDGLTKPPKPREAKYLGTPKATAKRKRSEPTDRAALVAAVRALWGVGR